MYCYLIYVLLFNFDDIEGEHISSPGSGCNEENIPWDDDIEGE